MAKKKYIIEIEEPLFADTVDEKVRMVHPSELTPLDEYMMTDTPYQPDDIEPKYSVEFLLECVDLQLKKSNDYQNPNSTVRQADYYPSGIKTIDEILHAKKLRLRSLIETAELGDGSEPNFESIEDTLMDIVNYCSFMASYINYKIDGQDDYKGLFNK